MTEIYNVIYNDIKEIQKIYYRYKSHYNSIF